MRETVSYLMGLTPLEMVLWSLPAGVLLIGALALNDALKGPSVHGDARFASWWDIRKSGLRRRANGDGIVVGKYRGTFLVYSEWFVALLAKTRAGKGVAVVIPTLLSWMQSGVVLDVKGENFAITSRWRALFQQVFCFAPFSMHSHGWNPLEYIKEYDDLMQVPEVLSVGYSIYPHVEGDNGIWNDTARSLFVGLVLYLLETPELPLSIGEVLRQTSGKGKGRQKRFAQIIKQRAKSDRPLSRRCVESLEEFIDASPNTASSIINTLTAPLALWRSPVVDAATTKSDFSLRRLRRDRMFVYVKIPVNKLDESRLLINMFFSQMIKQNTDIELGYDPEPNEEDRVKYKCLLMLDEALAPGFIKALHVGAAFMASYGIILVTIAQSLAQVATPTGQGGYGREGSKALLDNHGLSIQFPPKSDDIDAASEISAKLGPKTVWVKSQDRTRPMRGNRTQQARPLMLPHEILNMSPKKQFIFVDGCLPILCDKVKYYEEPVFMDRLKMACPELAAIKGLPTLDQIKAIRIKGGLESPVPKLILNKAIRIKGGLESPVPKLILNDEEPAMPYEPADDDEGGREFTDLPKIGPEPVSRELASQFADSFLAAIGAEPEIQP